MSIGLRGKIFKIIYIVLMIIALIILILGLKSINNKEYRITFYSILIIFWSLVGMFPRDMVFMGRSVFRINSKKKIQIKDDEIWIYRILSLVWILLSIKTIINVIYK